MDIALGSEMWLVQMPDFVFGSMTLVKILLRSVLLVSQIRVGTVIFGKKNDKRFSKTVL